MLGAGADLSGHWPVEAQNLINSEVFSFGHPDALLVMALWGEAQLALYDAAAWTRFDLARLVPAGETVSALQQPRRGVPAIIRMSRGLMASQGEAFRRFRRGVWSFSPAIMRSGVTRAGFWLSGADR